MHVETTPDGAVLSNGLIELRVSTETGQCALSLSAWQDDVEFVPVLERTGDNDTRSGLKAERPEGCEVYVEDDLADSAHLVLRGKAGAVDFVVNLRLQEASAWVEIDEVLALPPGSPALVVDWMEAVWRFVGWREPGEVFSPSLVPEADDVVGRHAMRSPTLSAQSRGRAAALIYSPDSIRKQQALPACMNLLRESDGTPVFRIGLRPHKVRGHVYYTYAPPAANNDRERLTASRPFHHTYHVYVAADSEPGASLDAANRRLWSRFGTRHLKAAPPMPASYEDYARQIYPRALDLLWRETQIDGKRVGAVTLNRAYPGDVWMCPWFNQLRSAYGLYVWGKETSNRDWINRAIATRDLVLTAPQSRGLFPTVFVFGDAPEDCRWAHSHHQGGGPGVYHLFDMSWTITQLLRWHQDLLEDPGSLRFARTYGKGLLALQAPDGSFPAYVDAQSFTPIRRIARARLIEDLERHGVGDPYVRYGVEHMWPEARFVHSAEDAGTMLALAELARVLPDDDPDRAEFLESASRNAEWLASWVYPEHRWLDFEVIFSCSPKSLDFYDARSRQWPQNTLCMHAAAGGFLTLYELIQDARYRQLAQRAMDRLSLYQQVWDPPFLSFHGFGGYCVMNTDGEWNDARQAQFADTHLDFWRVLGSEEHRERAIAACRAAFTTLFLPIAGHVYPTGWHREPQGLAAENHAHGGEDMLCGVSGFDWGAGSALATAAYFRLRDVV